MQNITIGRYKPSEPLEIPGVAGVPGISVDVAAVFDGWIEGTRDDGSTWIMWLDALGNPLVYFPDREADGAVIGEGIDLSRPGDPLHGEIAPEPDGTDQPS